MPVRLSRLVRKAETTLANSLLVSVMRTTGSVTGSAGGSVAQALSTRQKPKIAKRNIEFLLKANKDKHSDLNNTNMNEP